MTPKILFILILTAAVNICYSQLPNQRTYLLANLNNYPGYSGIWGYVDDNQREYALLGCVNGTSFVDITDSSNIVEIDFVPGLVSNWREIKTYSHYAYVVSEAINSKLQIIDLQYLPDSVSLVATWNYSGYTYTHAISQSGPYLYLSGGNACANGGVQILDVTDPLNPVRRGNNTSRYVHDCRVIDDTIWATNILNQKVSVINSTDKDNVQEIRNFNTLQSSPHNIALTDDRKYMLLTYENTDPGKLEFWDVKDLQNITYITNWQPTDIVTSGIHNIEIYDTLAIAAHYTAGIRIIDISDPAVPVEIAWYDTRPQDNSNTYNGCWGVYKFPSGKIVGSDVTNGLFVIKLDFLTEVRNNSQTIPEKFELEQNYPNPFNPETNVGFGISHPGLVSLKVYDALGKEVAVLVNEIKSAGRYNVAFDGSDLPSGIYFYKLETETFSNAKKMILLK